MLIYIGIKSNKCNVFEGFSLTSDRYQKAAFFYERKVTLSYGCICHKLISCVYKPFMYFGAG